MKSNNVLVQRNTNKSIRFAILNSSNLLTLLLESYKCRQPVITGGTINILGLSSALAKIKLDFKNSNDNIDVIYI